MNKKGQQKMKEEKEKKLYSDIGNKLYNLRISSGFTINEVAEAMNLSLQQYRKYELADNRVSLYKLIKLCGIYNVKMSYFLGDEYDNVSIFTGEERRKKVTRELIKEFSKIDDINARKVVFDLVKLLAK